MTYLEAIQKGLNLLNSRQAPPTIWIEQLLGMMVEGKKMHTCQIKALIAVGAIDSKLQPTGKYPADSRSWCERIGVDQLEKELGIHEHIKAIEYDIQGWSKELKNICFYGGKAFYPLSEEKKAEFYRIKNAIDCGNFDELPPF